MTAELVQRTLTTVLRFEVLGESPVPQGSMTPFPVTRVVKGGARVPVMNRKTGLPLVDCKPSNEKRLKAWRRLVAAVARDRWGARDPLDVPVVVSLEFTFRRPLDHFGTGRNAGTMNEKGRSTPYPTGVHRGDVDKFERAVLDALTEAGVYVDDRLVFELHGRKVWGDHNGVRAWIQVES